MKNQRLVEEEMRIMNEQEEEMLEMKTSEKQVKRNADRVTRELIHNTDSGKFVIKALVQEL